MFHDTLTSSIISLPQDPSIEFTPNHSNIPSALRIVRDRRSGRECSLRRVPADFSANHATFLPREGGGGRARRTFRFFKSCSITLAENLRIPVSAFRPSETDRSLSLSRQAVNKRVNRKTDARKIRRARGLLLAARPHQRSRDPRSAARSRPQITHASPARVEFFLVETRTSGGDRPRDLFHRHPSASWTANRAGETARLCGATTRRGESTRFAGNGTEFQFFPLGKWSHLGGGCARETTTSDAEVGLEPPARR